MASKRKSSTTKTIGRNLKTLKKVHRTIKRAAKLPAPKKHTTQKPNENQLPSKSRKTYSISDLKLPDGVTLPALLRDAEKHVTEIDGLKKPDELWALSVGRYKTYILKYSIADVLATLNDSVSFSPSKITRAQRNELIKSIKVVKVKQPGNYFNEYREQKKRGREKHAREFKETVRREVKEEIKAEQKPMLRRIASTMNTLKDANKKLMQQNKKLERQLSKLKQKPAAKKSAAKKKTTKGAKHVTRQDTKRRSKKNASNKNVKHKVSTQNKPAKKSSSNRPKRKPVASKKTVSKKPNRKHKGKK